MNSKNKGNRWERAVAAWLTEWTGYKFERNRAGSGSWWGNKDAGADITCTDEKHAHRCRLSIECKTYKDIRFEHVLLENKGCDIIKFWEQACRDANRTHKVPILCMRYNSMPRKEFFFVVSQDMLLAFKPLLDETHMTLKFGEHNVFIFMASKVKAMVNYKLVHKEAKKLLRQ